MQKFSVNLQKGIKFFLLLDRGHYYGSLWIGLWGSLKGSLGFLSQGQSYDLTRVALGRKAHCRLSIQAKSFVCLQARVTQSYRYLLTDSTWLQFAVLGTFRDTSALFASISWRWIVTGSCSGLCSKPTFSIAQTPWWPAAPVTVDGCCAIGRNFMNGFLKKCNYWQPKKTK